MISIQSKLIGEEPFKPFTQPHRAIHLDEMVQDTMSVDNEIYDRLDLDVYSEDDKYYCYVDKRMEDKKIVFITMKTGQKTDIVYPDPDGFTEDGDYGEGGDSIYSTYVFLQK